MGNVLEELARDAKAHAERRLAEALDQRTRLLRMVRRMRPAVRHYGEPCPDVFGASCMACQADALLAEPWAKEAP